MAPTLYDQKPKPGDLIEISRGIYKHWALYIGNDFVVHLAPDSEVLGAGASRIMSLLRKNAYVKKEKLLDVVGTDKWKIKNSLDEEYEPRPVDVIVKKACASVGKKLLYSVATENCEHFVTELRYGELQSRQVRTAAMATGRTTGVIGGVQTGALVGRLFGRIGGVVGGGVGGLIGGLFGSRFGGH